MLNLVGGGCGEQLGRWNPVVLFLDRTGAKVIVAGFLSVFIHFVQGVSLSL